MKTNIEKYLIKHGQKWKFYCIHIAAIFDENFIVKVNTNEICGLNYVGFFFLIFRKVKLAKVTNNKYMLQDKLKITVIYNF